MQLKSLSIRIETRADHLPIDDGLVALTPIFAVISKMDNQWLQHLRVLRLFGHQLYNEDLVSFCKRKGLERLDLWVCCFLEPCEDKERDEGVEEYVRRVTGFESLRTNKWTRDSWKDVNGQVVKDEEESDEE